MTPELAASVLFKAVEIDVLDKIVARGIEKSGEILSNAINGHITDEEAIQQMRFQDGDALDQSLGN